MDSIIRSAPQDAFLAATLVQGKEKSQQQHLRKTYIAEYRLDEH